MVDPTQVIMNHHDIVCYCLATSYHTRARVNTTHHNATELNRRYQQSGQVTCLLRSLELRAISHCTVLLLWDQKLLFRMRNCFEGSKPHLPTR